MTFKSKAKVGLMTAAKIFRQKSRGYAKIGIGSQYGLAKISLSYYIGNVGGPDGLQFRADAIAYCG